MSESSQQYPQVQPGQVWADVDSRSRGRTIQVISVVDGRATCKVLTKAKYGRDTTGRITSIAVKRFRPNSTGYRLLTGDLAAEAVRRFEQAGTRS